MSEELYNKACEYGRHDLCILIANRRETGEQQYKDKVIDYIMENKLPTPWRNLCYACGACHSNYKLLCKA